MIHPTKRVAGPGAASTKYDVLTALGAAGLGEVLGPPMIAMRLITLITARYNWQRGEMNVGQREMARMWQVSERTAKRDIRHWTSLGLLVCVKPAVRGRVAVYRLDLPTLWRLTQPAWDRVGSDFTARMTETQPDPPAAKVIRLADHTTVPPDPAQGDWAAISDHLLADDPARHQTWIAPLVCQEQGADFALTAPSKFAASYIETHLAHWIGSAVQAVSGPGRRVILTTD